MLVAFTNNTRITNVDIPGIMVKLCFSHVLLFIFFHLVYLPGKSTAAAAGPVRQQKETGC